MPCMASPRRISGRYFCCCAGVPNIISALAWIAAPIRGASRALHGLHEGDLLERRARLAAEFASASPIRSSRSCRYRARIRASNSRLEKGLASKAALRSPDQFSSSQAAPARATRWPRGRDHIAAGRRRRGRTETRPMRRRASRRAAERDRVKMHALEMAGRLDVLRHSRWRPNVCWVSSETCRSASHAEGNRGIDEIAPIPVVAIVQMRGVVERQPHAFKRDQAVRELVLDRLEFADRLAELLSLLGIVDRQVESRARGAVRPRHQHQLGLEQPVIEKRGRQIDTARRRVFQSDLVKSPGAHRPGRLQLDAGSVQARQRSRQMLRLRRRGACSLRRLQQSAAVRWRGHPTSANGARAWHRDRVRRTKTPRAPCQSCSLSSKPTAASASTGGQRQIGQRRRPHRRRTGGAAEFGHHHQDLAKSAFAEIAAE